MGYLSRQNLSQELSLAKEEVDIHTPILSTMLKAGLENDVKKKIADSIVNCCYSLGIDMPTVAFEMLVSDILDTYKFEAITDVLTALKYIRTGILGTTYNKLNMIALRESMRIVLEEKAKQREENHNNTKKEAAKVETKIDYQAYIDRERKKKKEEEKPSLSQMQYNELKHQYFNKKKD
jgi:hypothetical protein